jgi:hypothetical protein
MYTAVKPEIHVSSSNNSLVGDIKPQAEHNIHTASILLFYTAWINKNLIFSQNPRVYYHIQIEVPNVAPASWIGISAKLLLLLGN